MKINAVLFDLDGTLLPMDQDQFVKTYFGLLAAKMAPLGYEPEKLIKSIWAGTAAMVKNDGSRTNEAAFWQVFAQIHGEEALKDKGIIDSFYHNEFLQARSCCGFAPGAAEAIRRVKAGGRQAILATNPIFPAPATENRIRWAGLAQEDFSLYTTYEHCSYCKPNPDYYREILARTGLHPEECLMVGNDVQEDMVARELGMEVFLLTDCLINKDGRDISVYPHGDYPQLLDCLDHLN